MYTNCFMFLFRTFFFSNSRNQGIAIFNFSKRAKELSQNTKFLNASTMLFELTPSKLAFLKIAFGNSFKLIVPGVHFFRYFSYH